MHVVPSFKPPPLHIFCKSLQLQEVLCYLTGLSMFIQAKIPCTISAWKVIPCKEQAATGQTLTSDKANGVTSKSR